MISKNNVTGVKVNSTSLKDDANRTWGINLIDKTQ